MSEIFPNEGLDVVLGVFPKGGAAPDPLYVGLFTGPDGTSVPAAAATRAAMGSGFAEVAYTGYALQPIAASAWGAAGDKTVWSQATRGVDGPQVSFPAATAAYNPANPIAGFFLVTAASGGYVIYYSNFDDTSTIASLSIGDVIKVTPTLGFGG